jgi:DNA processing protein
LALALVPELHPTRAFALSARLGGPDAVLATGVDQLVQAGIAGDVAASVTTAAGRVPAELAALARIGGRVLAWSDADYPAVLRHIPDPPLALMVRGDLPGEDEVAIAIVGTRHATSYGRRIAEELARDLATAGVTVVSGLAAGIDAAAHRGALEAGGRTLAVLGTGVDVVYPRWHRELAAAVAGQGALVSEFACGTAPLAFHFPRRNRLISGLTRGTIVVEAAEKSGSLITARYALEQGREVFAVPGPLGPVVHQGPHRLIREGARLVRSAGDVLAELAPALRRRLAAHRRSVAEAVLTACERQLLDAVGSYDAHVDDVIRTAAVPPATALETLLALELRGLVRQLPGKRFRRQAA